MKKRQLTLFALYFSFAIFLLASGEVAVFDSQGEFSPLFFQVFTEIRLPKLLMALGAGGSLALCGLMLQTFFQNPLAGPFVLGVQSGASFGVALWVFLFSSSAYWLHSLGTTGAAFIGSLGVMALLIWFSHRVLQNVSLLIVGLLLSFFVSGALNILVVMRPAENLKSFFVWTLGSFSRNDLQSASIFLFLSLVFLFIALWLSDSLNKWLLGERYAESLGVSRKTIRVFVIGLSSLMVALVTALCGPIAFVGLMAPHMTRFLFRTADHQVLIFHTFIVGGALSMFSALLAGHWTPYVLPVNSVLSLLGIPLFVVIFLLPKNRGLFVAKGEES